MFRKIRYSFENRYVFQRNSLFFMLWESIIMNLRSQGAYLDENYRTNPSRYLPGPKPPHKKLKNADLGVSGDRGEDLGGFGRIK